MNYSTYQVDRGNLDAWVKENPSPVIGSRQNIQVLDRMQIGDANSHIICEVIQYDKLLGNTNMNVSERLWFMSQQNMKCRQINFQICNSGVKIEQGAMSYFQGNLDMTSGVNLGNLVGNAFRGALTGEKLSFPEYRGSGLLVLEPSFKFFILLNLNPGETIVCDKGMFYCASLGVKIEPYLINKVSGALLGNEGIFQTALTGPGMVVLEQPVPMPEITEVELHNDVLKVDGNFALLRDASVTMTVERQARTLVGSAMSGEGLVNVFRGTGRVWLAPSIKIYDALSLAQMRGGDLTAVDMNTQTGRAR